MKAGRWALGLLCLLLALPVVGVLAALGEGGLSLQTLAHQWATVLPGYALQSLLLCAGVAVGVTLVGTATAAAVTLFEFPGRRVFEWALLLPMAMPAYVLAYAATDALQYSGALQLALRQWTGWRGALWPDVRSLGGAVVLFVLVLYPYVYLLTRSALGERTAQLLEAARLLGAGTTRRLLTVGLPLARPAVAAGVALVVMETLADYGVGSYFGLSTFSTGIIRAWLVMEDPAAAAQLALVLLTTVALLLALERRARRRLRFAGRGSARAGGERRQTLTGRAAWAASGLCLLPVLLGFVLPVIWLLRMLWEEGRYNDIGLPWQRFLEWSQTSLELAALASLMATVLALAVGFALRGRGGRSHSLLRASSRLLGLGYAVPGAVLAVGVLAPVAWVQSRWPGLGAPVLVTGTLFGVMAAYLCRFSAVALQTVDAGYTRVPANLDESALLLGAGRPRLLWQVHLPMLRRSALTAGLLVFVDVMKELPATLALRPFGSDTLAVVAYNLARDERLGEAALPSLAIVAVGLVPVLLLSRALREGGSSSDPAA